MNAIFNRKSIRKYKDTKIGDETVLQLLKAGMAAPSAGNEQPWEFVVLTDKAIMGKIAEVLTYGKMLPNAQAAILVCGDLSKEVFKGCWIMDCSAATENILLEAESQGLGSVWVGVYPVEERITGIKGILDLPEHIMPLSIIPIGYPDEQRKTEDRFDKDRVHYNQW